MVQSCQSRFTLLAADRPSAAAALLTSPHQTRVGVSRRRASGHLSRRRRVRPRFTPGSRACAYRTASGRAEWLSRDPIGEAGGKNLYCMVWNDSVSFWDYLGFGCLVNFNCTLNPAWTRPGGLANLVLNCPYSCKEAGRSLTYQGTVQCDEVPANLTLNIDKSVFCRSCPKTITASRLFMDGDLKTDCSRGTCRAGCDLTFNALIKSKNPAVSAAALAARAVCYDGCNAICRNP